MLLVENGSPALAVDPPLVAAAVGFVVADVSSVKAVFGVPAAVLKDVKEGSPLSISTASLRT